MHRIENAIIMAAGEGTRLRPLTLDIPKPLLPIRGKPMIEQLIETLRFAGISDIVVVVGYKKEQFLGLASKYEVHLVENPDYDRANNIASLYYARSHLRNTVILDGDQIIHNPAIVKKEFPFSGYCCRYTEFRSKEWILTLGKNDEILSCARDGGENGWELLSLSFWAEGDSALLKTLLEKEYRDNRMERLYWDDIPMFLHRDSFRLRGYRVGSKDITEIDSIEEYERANMLVEGERK